MVSPIEIRCVLVRTLSPRFAACVRQDPTEPIDVDRARAQHETYVAALRAAVAVVIEVPGAPEHPDGVFVEDAASMIDGSTALITRPGAPSRRAEVDSVASALAALGVERIHMRPPAMLDGGDVLPVGGGFLVGLSARTNAAGAEVLAAAARERGLVTKAVPVRWGLHLRTGCTLADESTLLFYRRAALDVAPLTALGLECVAVDEPQGANVLALGKRRVLVSSAGPKTADLLARRGLEVTVLDVSELHKADAALTCPSVRVPVRGGWCT